MTDSHNNRLDSYYVGRSLVDWRTSTNPRVIEARERNAAFVAGLEGTPIDPEVRADAVQGAAAEVIAVTAAVEQVATPQFQVAAEAQRVA